MSDGPMKIDQVMVELAAEIAALKARLVVTDEMMHHLREIYKWAFVEGSYDPSNATTESIAKGVWPHIKALNAVLHFKK